MSLFCAAPPARHCSRRQSLLLLLLLLRPLSSFGPTTSRPFFPSFLPSFPPTPSFHSSISSISPVGSYSFPTSPILSHPRLDPNVEHHRGILIAWPRAECKGSSLRPF
ncbi:hypothetical protein EDB80DRAFT_727078 [Ilyonectria destructans]|nr:hypothetical protein EDB80DRAFT_727078 [Ilyonectria destructans]